MADAAPALAGAAENDGATPPAPPELTLELAVEPASAASIAGLVKLAAAGTIEKGATIACTLTGHGLKDPESAMRVCPEATRIPPDVDRALEVMKL